MNLSTAIEGFLLEGGTHYAAATVYLHRINLTMFCKYTGDPAVEDIKTEDLVRWLSYLKNDYQPRRFPTARRMGSLSPSALSNHWKSLRAFFGWCWHRMGVRRPDLGLQQPRFKLAEVVPFSRDETTRLLVYAGANFADTDKHKYKMRRPTALRDVALVSILLETGVRLGELCRLQVQDLDKEGGLMVRPFGSGQKTKPRMVYLGQRARFNVWRYLAERQVRPEDPLLPLAPKTIRHLLYTLGQRAGVDNVHPHRFRHTFAIEYLRNGGDVFTLQRLLGHSTLAMVNHYVAIVEDDKRKAHHTASPMDNWKI